MLRMSTLGRRLLQLETLACVRCILPPILNAWRLMGYKLGNYL